MSAVEPPSSSAAAAPAPAVKRICAVLDPRLKSCSVQHFRSGCEVLQERAENNVKKMINKFEEAPNQSPMVVEVEAGVPDAPVAVAVAGKRQFLRLD